MDLFARAVEAVRSEANANQVVVVGHSMGSPVVIRYAQLYPEHTQALVLVDGLMPAARNPNATTPSFKRSALMAGQNGRRNRETMIRGFFSAATTPALQTKILDMMLGASEMTAVAAMDATDEPVGPPEALPAVPVLGIYAGRPLAGRDAVLKRFPNAEYTQIPGTGHFLMLEKPEEFNRLLLAFLWRL